MTKADPPLTERFEMRATPDWIARVDDWRRSQPSIPSRAEAIRQLIDLVLVTDPTPGPHFTQGGNHEPAD